MNNKNVALLNALGLLGITFVLLMASVLQVVLNELPCPLCLLQRLGFMLVMFGFMLNVIYGPQQRHYGILIIGALFGAATALRQVSLHVIPGTPGFGSPVFGIHYYTWAFILFSLTIVGVAVLQLLWNKDWNNNDYKMNRFGKFVCLVAIFAVVINVISTFIECGPYQCPDNPITYWLFN
ncbi:disulfide bond formation protein B [Photobacterium phosphoreum]|jgi:disulfide bond formation protein DsbB|uniref:Disulfide bond formation protein B n=1 Tax=Photobacterium phosphoreum TaxID=659 RepID=A0A2T3JH27_PHOPO|nr:disulfide bond formation protein B [Photobacterium phosphoreum]KJF85178.1 disulfide bond formation protein B [Photobacterium phosphoreum]MCD9465333.1 disulfide bond formation protein B [Photobacterium phosphoreum]MCD9472167.1 disulfide bond formation protein B [Photobacterium phosphoreum]MCD9476230.1 disulfide bond formation protein B [Photobacterium phosphoreum]MCD9484791.1 disulfide bond formation protein B [Photobacterium phosphoreum]